MRSNTRSIRQKDEAANIQSFNLNYSELSFLWEAWLKVKINNKTEAIVNTSQKKRLPEYQDLMEQCFREYYLVLKLGHDC